MQMKQNRRTILSLGLVLFACLGFCTSAHGGDVATNVYIGPVTNDVVFQWNWTTQYWLNVESTAYGDVTPGDNWHDIGTNVPLTAAADSHCHFTHWSGDTNGCVIIDNVITAAMTQVRTITANFAIDEHTLTVESTHGGTDPGTETADYNTALSQYVTNSPVSGGVGTQYVCTAGTVAGNAYTQVNPTNVTLTLTNDATLTWQWQTQYDLATATNGSGSVTDADGWYDSGASTVLTATAAANWHFSHWSGAHQRLRRSRPT